MKSRRLLGQSTSWPTFAPACGAPCFQMGFICVTIASIYPVAVFLKLGSAKGCQRFRETKMRNGGRV